VLTSGSARPSSPSKGPLELKRPPAEKNHVVEKITEEPGNLRYGISFRHLAAIYWVRKDSPKASDWLALLKRSQSEKRPVNFHHVVGWAQITYLELAQP
jgi:hypothetical protein